MSNKDKIRSMLDNIVGDKGEQAQVDFHDYLQGKMKEVLGVELPAADETDADTKNDTEGDSD